MVFNPFNKRKQIRSYFPLFVLDGCSLSFVSQFKYLGHIIDNNLCDDADIARELKCLFARTNIVLRRFCRCSVNVKLKLIRCFCICFYDMVLWSSHTVAAYNKLLAGYIKCMKSFFGIPKFSSVTSMLLQLGLPSFSTIMHNNSVKFYATLSTCENS